MSLIVRLDTFGDGDFCGLASFVDRVGRECSVEVVGPGYGGGAGVCTAVVSRCGRSVGLESACCGFSRVSGPALGVALRQVCSGIAVGGGVKEGSADGEPDGVIDVLVDGSVCEADGGARTFVAVGHGGVPERSVGLESGEVGAGVEDVAEGSSLPGGGSVGDGESVGKQHFKNVRKRERAKAKKLVVRSGAEAVRGAALDSGCDTSGSVRPGVSYAAVASGEAAVPVGRGDGSGCVFGSIEKGAVEGSSSSFGRGLGGVGFQREDLESATTVVERRELARQWFDRKRTENELSIQRNKYNIKRNSYLDRARISEKKWEQERLVCEQKLAKITEARFGSKPGYAETLASVSDGSEIPPSLSTGGESPANLSDGTISPGSSMSVAEENRLKKKVEDLAGEVAQLKLERVALNAACKFSGGKAVVEGGRVHVYDGSGQYVPPTPVYGSECELYSMGDYPEELQYS